MTKGRTLQLSGIGQCVKRRAALPEACVYKANGICKLKYLDGGLTAPTQAFLGVSGSGTQTQHFVLRTTRSCQLDEAVDQIWTMLGEEIQSGDLALLQ